MKSKYIIYLTVSFIILILYFISCNRTNILVQSAQSPAKKINNPQIRNFYLKPVSNDLSLKENLTLEFKNNVLVIFHNNALLPCVFDEVNAEIDLNQSEINIKEIINGENNTQSECRYNIGYKVYNLKPSIYNINFISHNNAIIHRKRIDISEVVLK